MIEQLTHQIAPIVEQEQQESDIEKLVQLLELNLAVSSRKLDDAFDAATVQTRNMLLEELSEDPVRLFETHFQLLQGMYHGRTIVEQQYDGTVVQQFVTRNPARERADLHFRELTYASGSVERVVEVPRNTDEGGLPFFVSLRDDQLRIAASVYRRGGYERIEVPADSDKGEELLSSLFTHAIVASDLVYNRTPEQASEADAQARQFLARRVNELRTLN